MEYYGIRGRKGLNWENKVILLRLEEVKVEVEVKDK